MELYPHHATSSKKKRTERNRNGPTKRGKKTPKKTNAQKESLDRGSPHERLDRPRTRDRAASGIATTPSTGSRDAVSTSVRHGLGPAARTRASARANRGMRWGRRCKPEPAGCGDTDRTTDVCGTSGTPWAAASSSTASTPSIPPADHDVGLDDVDTLRREQVAPPRRGVSTISPPARSIIEVRRKLRVAR